MVKYAPRKVYIRESGGYVELSYTEFCRCRESDQTYMDKLFIPIQGCLLEVVREQYTDFYRDKERWRYLQKLDTKNRLLSLDGFTDSEGNPLDFITDEAVDIAETVVNAVMVDRLKAALPLLSDSEQELIQAIFFDGLSEREVGARLGITQSVVNKRKARILIKLRKIIENSSLSNCFITPIYLFLPNPLHNLLIHHRSQITILEFKEISLTFRACHLSKFLYIFKRIICFTFLAE